MCLVSSLQSSPFVRHRHRSSRCQVSITKLLNADASMHESMYSRHNVCNVSVKTSNPSSQLSTHRIYKRLQAQCVMVMMTLTLSASRDHPLARSAIRHRNVNTLRTVGHMPAPRSVSDDAMWRCPGHCLDRQSYEYTFIQRLVSTLET